MRFSLGNQIIGDVPEEHISVVTRGNQSVLFVVDLLLVLLEVRKLFQQHGVRPSGLSYFAATCFHKFRCLGFGASHLVGGFALVDCVFDLVVHVQYHLLLLFLSRGFVFVFLKIRIALYPNIIVQVICHRVEGIWVVELVLHLLLQELEVVLLEVLVEPDTVHEVLMPHTSHNWHDIDCVAVVLYLEVVCNEAVIFKADGQHALIWRYVEAKWLAVVVLRLESDRHLDGEEVEEPDVVVIASRYQKENLLILSSGAGRFLVSWCLELAHLSHSLIDGVRRLISESPSVSHALPRGINLRVHFILLF